LFAGTHAPVPLRDSPGGQTGHRPLRHGAGRLNSAVCTGFRKGWRTERELFFSGAALALAVDDLGNDAVCDADAPVLPTCEAEALKVWLLVELAEEPPPE